MDNWKSIDTAPFDETKILVSDGNEVAYVWGSRFGSDKDFYHRTNEMGYYRFTRWTPTHWMPLPNPPSPTPDAECEARAALLAEVLRVVDEVKADIAYDSPVAVKYNAGAMRRVVEIRTRLAALSDQDMETTQ